MTELRKLQCSNSRLGIMITGGGTILCHKLLGHGGSSSLVDSFNVPYSMESLVNEIGSVESFCNTEISQRLSDSVLQKLDRTLTEDDRTDIAVGVTASLTRGPDDRKGRTNEAFITIQSKKTQLDLHLKINDLTDFNIYEGNRESQESLVADTVLDAIYYFTGIKSKLSNVVVVDEVKHFVFPGSFNPVHSKHIEIATVMLNENPGSSLDFEFSAVNADKEPVTRLILAKRGKVISEKIDTTGDFGVIYSKNAFFIDKAKENPFSTFLVGMDTFTRILDTKYYHDSENIMLNTFYEMCVKNKCKFMVFERQGSTKPEVPTEIAQYVEFVPTSIYKDDGTSSTIVRAALEVLNTEV